ncbi:interferon-inducible GTPase-domain-containing protein [Scleroderma citrinum]
MRKELAAQGRSAEETDQKTKSKEADIREISRREQEILRKIRIAEEVRRCSLVSTKPKDTPSPDEIKTMKQRIEYDEQLFHIAVVGLAGSGKSSLINAVRGLCNNSPDAAPTGVTEMTPEVKRYPPTNNQPVAWYDIPGAGTLSVPGWQYFRTQGLYVFDCIIVLMNERFTETDIAILDNCRQLKIPAYIVRSKADQHICNIISLEMGYGSDAEDDELENYYFQKHYKAARKQLIEQTSQSVKSNLKRANLPDQRVYIVSAKAIYSTVMNKNSQKTIDKIDLIKDLYLDAHENRGSDAQDMALEEAGQEAAAKEEILRFWKAGIQPAEIPTEEEIQAMKDKAQYDDSIFHIAIAGVSGSGKSSLINAFRGLRSKKPGAAPVGVTETTTEMARYPPSNSEHPLAWYDIPGACTRKFSGWEYFKKQGLYVFDAIIVLFDGRFTETDVTILENCRRFGIPSFIVRSKADLQILNIINEEESDDEEENGHDARRRQQQSETAKTKLVEKTQTSVKDNLEEAQLPDQRVYIISANNLRTLVENKRPQKVIHEIELLRDIYLEAHGSRASDALDLAIRDLAKWEGVFHQDRSPRSQYAEFVLQDWEHDL